MSMCSFADDRREGVMIYLLRNQVPLESAIRTGIKGQMPTKSEGSASMIAHPVSGLGFTSCQKDFLIPCLTGKSFCTGAGPAGRAGRPRLRDSGCSGACRNGGLCGIRAQEGSFCHGAVKRRRSQPVRRLRARLPGPPVRRGGVLGARGWQHRQSLLPDAHAAGHQVLPGC